MNLDILSKSYDIRGIYPTDIDEDFYYSIGFAFGNLLTEANNFAVGCDSRLSSQSLKKAMVDGIMDSGKNVVDTGLCSTDMIYFASGRYSEIDVGIMITASHNPKEYNGIKSCLKNAVPINMKEFGNRIREFIIDPKIIRGVEKGTYAQKDISDDFIEHIVSFIDILKIKPLRIVADAGNGVAGVFMEKLAIRLGFELIPMFFEPDGNFPNHHPSPIEKENVGDLINKVKELNADLGVAFDGDADRMYICDETGDILSGTITTAMISKLMLEKIPKKKILYNAVCGNIVPETIAENSGVGIRIKVGHVYFKEMMNADEDIIFGGEHSGHYFFRNNWNADSGVIAFAIILELVSKSSCKPSELRKAFEKYHSIEEINSKVTNVKEKIEELKSVYSSGIQDELDGLTIRFEDYWFNVRPSSNEPLLRLNLETNTEELLEEKTKELLNIIRN